MNDLNLQSGIRNQKLILIINLKTVLIVIGLILLTALIVYLLFSNKPEARKRPNIENAVSVAVSTIKPQNYPVTIAASGSVEALTRGNLIAQVRGEITYVSDRFNNGGKFAKGDTLLRIDNRSYLASTSNAEAALLQAQSNYSQEQVNAEQAQKDWQRLGFEGKPNALVLREPQLQAARAQLASAQAAYESAKLDLERTRISAPYTGYTISKQVDIGQYVTLGSVLGEIYADKGLEVSLPLTQNSFAQLQLEQKPAVILQATYAGVTHNWPAYISRADRVFDPTTRQITVVAKVSNLISNHGLKLKIGQYVNAYITGRIANDVYVVPNNSIREGNYVFLFDDGLLKRQNIRIRWQDEQNSIVEGITEGSQLVLTNLGSASSGTKAKIAGTEKQRPNDKNREQQP